MIVNWIILVWEQRSLDWTNSTVVIKSVFFDMAYLGYEVPWDNLYCRYYFYWMTPWNTVWSRFLWGDPIRSYGSRGNKLGMGCA